METEWKWEWNYDGPGMGMDLEWEWSGNGNLACFNDQLTCEPEYVIIWLGKCYCIHDTKTFGGVLCIHSFACSTSVRAFIWSKCPSQVMSSRFRYVKVFEK